MTRGLSTEEMAELAALADGTLPAERRPAVEARVAASPELQELVDRQRRSLIATEAVAAEEPPDSLRTTVEETGAAARRPGRGRSWRLVPGLAAAGAVAAIAAVALVISLAGGPSGPSVADAARVAQLPATGAPPARLEGSRTLLAAKVDGATFPDLRPRYGWRPVGVRHDEVDGRNATVVQYAKGGKRIGYVIVGGEGLPRPSGGTQTTRHGIEFQTLTVDGKPAVTWERLGHTCVLIGKASSAELLALASWRGGGTLSY
jgi:anti-sigma factor RsiW